LVTAGVTKPGLSVDGLLSTAEPGTLVKLFFRMTAGMLEAGNEEVPAAGLPPSTGSGMLVVPPPQRGELPTEEDLKSFGGTALKSGGGSGLAAEK
jgi:hypothetical protein